VSDFWSFPHHLYTDRSHRFNSDAYLRNPVVYDGVTKKTSKTGKKAKPFVHYFNTTGIMQHNDIAPQWFVKIRVLFAPLWVPYAPETPPLLPLCSQDSQYPMLAGK
jgi:hypothetical protein